MTPFIFSSVDCLASTVQQGLVDILAARCGLRVGEVERGVLSRLAGKRAEQLHLANCAAYLSFLRTESPAAQAECTALASELTPGESYFFRDEGQFALLREWILPERIAQRRHQRTLRIWSAGCAAGEEIYSLAILVSQLLAAEPDGASWQVDFLGTDMNQAALEKGRQAVYRPWAFRGVSPTLQSRYFTLQGEDWKLDDSIRRQVRFRFLELVHATLPHAGWGMAEMDLIVCRNVFIYLHPVAIESITDKFSRCLCEGGFLLTGHNELSQVPLPAMLAPLHSENGLVYRRKDGLTDGGLGASLAELPPPAFQLDWQPPPVLNPALWQAPAPRTASAANPASASASAGLPQQPPSLPRPPPENGGQRTEGLLVRARQAADRGQYDTARQLCQQALAAEPLNPQPSFLLGMVEAEAGEASEARALFNRVIYLDPSAIAAYLELSRLHAELGETARATKLRATACQYLRQLPPETLAPPYDTTAQALLDYFANEGV